MTILAANNFDSTTVGTLPSTFAIPGGSGSWSVQATDAVSSPNTLQCTSNATGSLLAVAGIAFQSDPIFTFSQKLTDTPSGSVDNFKAGIVMANADLTTGYMFLPKSTGSGTISIRAYKISGGYTQLSETAVSGTWASGDVLMTEIIRPSAGTIECRVWKSTGSRPSAASATITDSSFTSGTVGWYNSIVGTTNQVGIDDFQYANNAAATPATAVVVSLSAGSGLVGSPVTVTVSTDQPLTGAQSESVALTSNLAGTFSPTSVTLDSSNSSGTSTFTPSAAGNHTITGTATGTPTLTAGTASYTATAAGSVIPVTNSNVYFSPYNWYSDGTGGMQSTNIMAGSTFAWSGMRGAYLKFKATVAAAGSIALNINTATLSAISAAGCPQIAWSVGYGAWQSHTLVAGETSLSLATGLAAGTYDVFIYIRGVYITQDGGGAQNYTAINNRFQITGIQLSAGGTLSAPAIRGKRKAVFGDSITEGDLSNGGPRGATSQDSAYTYGWLLAEALDAEVGIIGFYGQTWSWFNSTWSNHAAGYSRLVSGLLSPAPDYVFINYGENDGDPGPSASTVTATLAAISAAAPSAKIILNIPFSGRARTNLSAATLPANGYRIDLARPEMINGNTIWSYDGQHPNQRGHANLAALLANAVQSIVPATAARTFSITLDSGSGPAANLTGLSVACYDQSTPGSSAAPVYKTEAGTTNASGVLSVTAQSTLSAGGTGRIEVRSASGQHYNGPVVVS